MSPLFDWLKSFFRGKARFSPEELRAAFRSHYKEFRALLTANNNALELMAGMEQALLSGQSFGMAFVRGNCTALSVNVYKMIQHLSRLAGGGYQELDQPFRVITQELEKIIAQKAQSGKGPLVLDMAEIDRHSVDQVGEKMANLGEVRNRVGLATPEGFVITASASRLFMESGGLTVEINRRLKGLIYEDLEALYTVSAGIQALISRTALPPALEEAIVSRYLSLARAAGASPDEVLVALRSSALGEDSGNVSFAGQYRTQLNVSREFVCQSYKEIVAGKYRSQAIVYRQQRGFRHQDVQMCVGCMLMVDAVVSGVMYSRVPDNPRSSFLVIQAALGLASVVVDGSRASVRFLVSRETPFLILEGEGLLSESQAAELARAGIRLEEHFGCPQDIEWSFDRQGRLIILQSRPLSQGAAAQSEPALKSGDDGLPDPRLGGGSCASRGVACGPVFIVRNSLDLLGFPKDAVLVVETPFPDWASLLNRAAAVISETGQLAAHLATVAREFGVPAIFGLPGALAALNNGELITVDATATRVYSGRVEELLAQAAPRPNLMQGSPVYNILKEALTRITPLNLTDPASPFFTPASCLTLHDITRFCHEKAVVEMFRFGERYGFADKAAKQLVVENAPAQWWVIDLDDGFLPDYNSRSRYIHLGQIVSVPMLAVWEGMMAVPWAGPPPVDLRGFGAIIFQSTRNPQLDPGVRSNLTARNYFLISKNFCNLSVRLGYHFALVEANLGEFLTENYVSFQFKGGAADESRRLLRIRLISEILSEFGFRVEYKVDALRARIEKKPAAYLLTRLRILGYLLIHTRQIDMAMADVAAAEGFREKMMTDLQSLLDGLTEENRNGDQNPAD